MAKKGQICPLRGTESCQARRARAYRADLRRRGAHTRAGAAGLLSIAADEARHGPRPTATRCRTRASGSAISSWGAATNLRATVWTSKSTRSRTTMPSCAAARRTNGRCSAPSSAIRSSGPAAPAEAARQGLDVTVCGKTYTGVCQCSRYITNPTERQCAFLRLMTELRRAYILETAVGTRQNLPPEK